ncbi:MAG: hypothetical protein HYV95_02585 [Opitutae bacterium]|nr:hypothetical protein [Opitutae bacterium]
MKKNFLLLSLVSLSLTVVAAKAASTQNDTRIVNLPAYRVVVPRLTSGERQIERNLAELRAEARTPMAVPVELPALATKAAVPEHVAEQGLAAKHLPMLVLAKN